MDLDAELERQSGCSIAKLIDTQGEEYFRTLETELLLRSQELVAAQIDIILPQLTAVIATGGGCVISPRNREFLQQQQVTFLDTPWETIIARLTKSPRPLFQGISTDEIYQIYLQRLPLYRQCATSIVLPVISNGI